MFSFKQCFLIIIMLPVLAGLASAGEVTKTGTTASKFLNVGVGPRAIAMGGAFTSIADDATAMYWNPSGIAFIERNEIVFSQTNWIADININFIGLVIPAGTAGNFGLSITALSMDDMEVTTEFNPDGLGATFSAGSYVFGLSYARKLYDTFAIGANIKYVREDISDSKAEGFALDIGTLFLTPFWGVKFSSSITNWGSKMQMLGDDLVIQYDPDPQAAGNNDKLDAIYGTDQFDLPLRLQIGFSRDFQIMENQRLTLAVDAAHPNDNTEYVNLGGELALFDEHVFLRGGYKTLWMQDQEENFSLGGGLRYKSLEFVDIAVDYSFQNFVHLGDVHSFGFLLRF